MPAVGRSKQPEIRERLLDTCTDHALATGLPDRLEAFAVASGTSTRMLLYHFGTKEALLRAVLRRARDRQRQDFEALLRVRPDEDYLTTLGRAWAGMTGAQGRLYLTMFGRLREDAEQQLWPGFRREATTDWLAPLEDGLSTLGRPELATLVLAVIRGLIMDLDATGDTARVDRAFADLLASLRDTASG
jgi:AcrR family transcriptional regulator